MKTRRFARWLAVSMCATFMAALVAAESDLTTLANRPNVTSDARGIATAAPVQRPVNYAQPAIYGSAGYQPVSVAVGDLNGDGKMDMVVANFCQSNADCFVEDATSTVSVLLGNGDGTFQAPVTYSSGEGVNISLALGDVNGDGRLDLIVVGYCANFCLSIGAGEANVLLGNGDGTFQPVVAYAFSGLFPGSLVLGDVNGDGKTDLVVANSCYIAENCFSGNGEGGVSILLGNGDGTFQSALGFSSGAGNGYSVAMGDLNGDGYQDLVVGNIANPGRLGVLLGNGDGTFQEPVISDSSYYFIPYSVAIADLNGDGHPDVVVANICYYGCYPFDGGEVDVLLGNGDGTLQPIVGYHTGAARSSSVVVADVNGDGEPDIIVASQCAGPGRCGADGPGKVSVLLGNGDGTFQEPFGISSGGKGANALAIGDVNGDGRPDVVVTNPGANTVGVLLNRTQFTSTTSVTSSLNPAQVNQTVMFTATIRCTRPVPNGQVITFYNDTTEIGTGTTTNGIATLSRSFARAKTYTIRAVYPGDTFRKNSAGMLKQVVNP